MVRSKKGRQEKKHHDNHPSNDNSISTLPDLVAELLEKCSTKNEHIAISKHLEEHREIRSLLEKIQKLEVDVKLPALHGARNLCNLVTWCKEAGALVDGVCVAEFAGMGFGLKATKAISQGEKFLQIPRQLMMTTESARWSGFGGIMKKDPVIANMDNVCLALHLLEERCKRSSSNWWPYIQCLPETFSTVLYFSCDEILELQGSPILEDTLKHYKHIARHYAYFHRLLSQGAISLALQNKFTYEGYRWAVSAVMTRLNNVPSEGGKSMVNALVPLWDMCNHAGNGYLSTDFCDESQCLRSFAFKDFHDGDQVFIYYGPRPNSELFLHNGFVSDNTENDTLALKLGISKNDQLYLKKSALLSKLGIPVSGNFFLKDEPHPVGGRLLAFLRIFSMNEDCLSHWLASERFGDLACEECPIKTEFEDKSWYFLLARTKLLLLAYPTTLKADEMLLQEDVITAHHRLCVQMRVREKTILSNCISYVEARDLRSLKSL